MSLHDGYSALLRAKGGNAGALQVYDRGGPEGLFALAPGRAEQQRGAGAAARAARALLRELHDDARAEGLALGVCAS